MNGTNENKVDSLIAELRSFGDRPPPRFAWKMLADELEAAVKEEREELREAATSKMLEGATIIDNRGQGNAAALREALVKIRDIIMCGCFDGRSPAHIVNICDAALAKPPRNCDIGTPKEQERRYKAIGEVYHTLTMKNALAWAQMLYKEGDEK